DDQSSIAIDQSEPEQQDRGGGGHVEERNRDRRNQREKKADNTDGAASGRPGQLCEAWPEDAFDPALDPSHLLDQSTKLGLLDPARVDPSGEPRAFATGYHLGRDDQDGNREEDAGSRRERQQVDRREDKQQSTPRAAVKLRGKVGKGQAIRPFGRHDLR